MVCHRTGSPQGSLLPRQPDLHNLRRQSPQADCLLRLAGDGLAGGGVADDDWI